MKLLGKLLADLSACGALLIAWPLAGEEWSQFRGPHGRGVATSGDLPTEWAADANVAWKVRLPGAGWSQPVVWGDKVFVTTAETDEQVLPNLNNWGPGENRPGLFGLLSGATSGGQPPEAVHRWKVLCLDAGTGDVAWERLVREGPPTMPIHANNTYASETPVADGERVYAYFGMIGIWCHDLAGDLVWKKDLTAFPTHFDWGTGSSPVLWRDLLFIQCDNEKASFLAALNKLTGDEVWRAERDERSNWSTPYVWKNTLRTELVTAGGQRVRSYDPETGELLWEMRGSGRTATTPAGNEALLFVDSYDRLTGRTGTFAAIRPGASGEVSPAASPADESHIAWSMRLSGYRVASPLVHEGYLYMAEQQSGIVRCLDAQTGQEHYRARLPGVSGVTASPLASGGNVYWLGQNGRTVVAVAGTELKIVASNDLDEMCWASPAVVKDRLLIRTIDHLYCIGP
jgi:outer membrane protein assembly factor BamB